MTLSEIICPLVEPLFEMAFQRRAIIERLRAYQDQINLHAIKIIVWPDAPEVTHWRRELAAWGNRLAAMDLRTNKRIRPMGFDLAWTHLYREPFELSQRALPFRLQVIGNDYPWPITKSPDQIMHELTTFLRAFCQAIGNGEPVNAMVNTLGQAVSDPAP